MFSRQAKREIGSRDRAGLAKRPVLEPVEPRLLMTVFMVTNAGDSGAGSLRQAILDVNATAGTNVIDFAITSGPAVIKPVAPLPFINNSVVIDGTTQAGFAGTPIVHLDGTNQVGVSDGLTFEAGGSTVKGLSFSNFVAEGLSFRGAGGNIVTGDVFLGNGDAGLLLSDAGGDRVGGFTAADAVVSSFNKNVGIEIQAGSNNNSVTGSFIGTDATGTASDGNGLDGIFIQSASGNTIGGPATASRNVIGGSSDAGIQIAGATASGNLIAGNQIGVGGAGEGPAFFVPDPSGDDGVFINGAPNNLIGEAVPGGGNLISGMAVGVQIYGSGATGNLVAGNLIGTDAAGSKAVPNNVGVYVNSASGNTIGGLTVSARNVISGNSTTGIDLEPGSAFGNLVVGNYVGLSASGTTALGNGRDGIFLNSSPGNTIGGSAAGAGNFVAGDKSVGIQLYGQPSTANVVSGNSIGLNVSKTAVGTGLVGLFLNGSPYNTITNNSISGGTYAGLEQTGSTAIGNVISGNTLLNNSGLTIAATNLKQNTIPVTGTTANQSSGGAVKVTSLKNSGPVVLSVVPQVVGATITGVALTFNAPLDDASAQAVANYAVTSGKAKVSITSATYNPVTLQVTLKFATPLSTSGSYRLVVSGHGRNSVMDQAGHRLYGKNNGRASGDFTASFGA